MISNFWRAWSWRRKLETGEAATIKDIAMAEKASTQFVGPIMRLVYLSPEVLDRLLLLRESPSAKLLQMIEATYLPWSEQMGRVCDGGTYDLAGHSAQQSVAPSVLLGLGHRGHKKERRFVHFRQSGKARLALETLLSQLDCRRDRKRTSSIARRVVLGSGH